MFTIIRLFPFLVSGSLCHIDLLHLGHNDFLKSTRRKGRPVSRQVATHLVVQRAVSSPHLSGRHSGKTSECGKEAGSSDPPSGQFLQRTGSGNGRTERKNSFSRCWESPEEQGETGPAGQSRIPTHKPKLVPLVLSLCGFPQCQKVDF